MNYKSQLRSWAVDRVIRMAEATKAEHLTVEEITAKADALVAYTYQADEDFNDACRRVVELLKESPDAIELVGKLQAELAFIEEQMNAQLNRSKPKEAVQ